MSECREHGVCRECGDSWRRLYRRRTTYGTAYLCRYCVAGYAPCYRCGVYVPDRDIYTIGGRPYCEDCYNDNAGGDSVRLDPAPSWAQPPPEGDIKIGFELEGFWALGYGTPGAYHSADVGFGPLSWLWYEEDGSLGAPPAGYEAGEVITPPMSPYAAAEVMAYLCDLDRAGDETTGLHVGVSYGQDELHLYPYYARAEGLLYALNGIDIYHRSKGGYARPSPGEYLKNKSPQFLAKYSGYHPKYDYVEIRAYTGRGDKAEHVLRLGLVYILARMAHDSVVLNSPLPMPRAPTMWDWYEYPATAAEYARRLLSLYGVTEGPGAWAIWPYNARPEPVEARHLDTRLPSTSELVRAADRLIEAAQRSGVYEGAADDQREAALWADSPPPGI